MTNTKEDRGLAVLMWATMVTFYMYQFVARSAFPTVLTHEYMKFFGLDAKGVGVLVSCYYFLYTFAQIPVGIIIDKFNLRLVATLSIAACATGVLLFISTKNYYIAACGQMMVGLGASSAFIMTAKTVINWFPVRKIAVMLSFTVSIGCIGPVIFGPLVAILVKTFNWRAVMLAFSIFGYVLAYAVWKIVREKTATDDNHAETETKSESIFGSLKIVFLSPQIWILGMFLMLQYSPLSALADLWGTSYIKKLYNADPAMCSLANNMIYLGLVFGSPFFSYLASVLDSYKKPLCFAIMIASIVFSLIMFLNDISLTMMFILFFILGFSSGAMLSYPLGATLFSKSMAGTVSGFLNMMSMVSGVVLMPLIGWLIDRSWDGTIVNGIKFYRVEDFRFGFMSVLIALLIGFVVSLFIKDKSLRNAN